MDPRVLIRIKLKLLIYKQEESKRDKKVQMARNSTATDTEETSLCCTCDRFCRQRCTDLEPYYNIEVVNALIRLERFTNKEKIDPGITE